MARIDLAEWDKAIDDPSSNKQELYDQIKKAHEDDKQNNTYFWRMTKGALIVGDEAAKNKNKELDKKMVLLAVEHGKEAVEKDGQSVASHKWYCAALGRAAPYVGIKERLQLGHTFKKHSDIACQMAPEDQLLHHMYGRWCYEVATLTWVERKLAATFFGTPPESTYQEAFDALMKAFQLKKEWKENLLWVGKALIALKKNDEAIKYIDDGLKLDSVTADDFVAHEELVEIEKKYTKYRK